MNAERFPRECEACGGTGFGAVGWLPSGGACPKCRGVGHHMRTDAEYALLISRQTPA